MDCSTPGLLSITNSRSLPKLMSIESVMPSNHLILCRPLLLLPTVAVKLTKSSQMETPSFGGQGRTVSPLWPGKALKLFFSTSPKTVSTIQFSTSAQKLSFQPHWGGHRQDSHCRMIMSGKEETFLHPSVFFWSI